MRLFKKKQVEGKKVYCSRCGARAFSFRKFLSNEVIGFRCSKGRCGNIDMLETEVQGDDT